MRVAIIGAGNVATVLGKLIKDAGHQIIQVVSRSEAAAATLAATLECSASSDLAEIDKTANLFIAAVSDSAVAELKEHMKVGDKIFVHTAGSVAKDVLEGISSNYGVLYPLQSLRKEQQHKGLSVPFLIDGNSGYARETLLEFARSISANVAEADDEQRMKLHIAAVITSNFTNHLYRLAADYCDSEQLNFNMLLPLIEQTAVRLKEHTAKEVQTGPAARKDIVTLDKHLRMLTPYPHLRTIYLKLTESIMQP